MGAEESKISHLKHEKDRRDNRSGSDYYHPGMYSNQHAYEREKSNYTDSYYGSLKWDQRQKLRDYSSIDRNKRNYEKENRDRRRRHHSDDRSLGHRKYDDKPTHRERVRSENRDSTSKKRNKADKRKKESPRTAQSTKETKDKKDGKNRKSSPESKPQSPVRKEKSEKQDKSSSCLPNFSQVKRRKKKVDLEKHKRAHRSAPDLSNDEMSRVGAWLNSNSFWSPESPGWNPGYSLSYGTLPGALPPLPLDASGKPQPYVDGMGSPLGTIYADGTFVPNASATNSLGRQTSFDPPSPFRYSLPPYFQYPHLPYYYHPPVPYNYFQRTEAEQLARPEERQNIRNRSRSDNSINAIGKEEKIEPIYASVYRVKKKQKNPPGSAPTEKTSELRDSVSSCPTPAQVQPGEYYSDIAETKDSMQHTMLSYTANTQIAVDEVKHVEMGPIKTPNITDTDSSSQSSLTDSSYNDVELGSDDVNGFPLSGKSQISIRTEPTTSNARFFKKMSQREIFIDDVPSEGDNVRSQSIRSIDTKTESRSVPVVRLGERESIVATSFLLEGEKVFCLTKSKQSPSKFSKPKKTEKDTERSQDCAQTAKHKVEKENSKQRRSSSKQNSGPWYGFTGSPPPVKLKAKDNSQESRLHGALTSSSSSSISSPSPRAGHIDLPDAIARNTAPSAAKSTSSFKPFSSPTKNISVKPTISLPNSPTPKPRVQRISPVKDLSDLDDGVFTKTTAYESVLTPRTNQQIKQNPSEDVYVSDSCDSEPLMRDDNHSITRKLIRIDSRDSFTMKRRLKYHRRSSSLSDKTAPRNDSFSRRATLPKTSRSDTQLNNIDTSGSTSNHNQYSASNILLDSPYSTEPYMDALLHKAKSEEILKQELNRSREELLSDFSPPRKKETLQERAARILGLSAGDLYKAKENQAAQKAKLFADLDAEDNATSFAELSITTVTSSRSAQGNIFHPPVASSITSPRSNDEEPSGSFAVSVTESMINRVPQTIEIKNPDSNSSEGVSSISNDSSTSFESSDYTPVPDAEFMIEVSDSVLEDATVPCRVKPHKETIYLNTAKEYKLPEEILVDAEVAISAAAAFSPTSAQASIVASYADSIYDRVPASNEISHASELSDDTTETESLDQSSRFLVKSKLQSKIGESLSETSTLERKKDQSAANSSVADRGKGANAMVSPVPVASFSAPLTQGELDIIRQLYNGAEDNASVSSYDSPVVHKQATPRNKTDLQKEKIAKAIGLNVGNIGQGSDSQPTDKGTQLEKVEDFEIKVFTGNQPGSSQSSNAEVQERKKSYSTETKSTSTESEVEVMQSLGLNPEETWLVSL